MFSHVQSLVLDRRLVKNTEMPKGKNQGEEQSRDYGMDKKTEDFSKTGFVSKSCQREVAEVQEEEREG